MLAVLISVIGPISWELLRRSYGERGPTYQELLMCFYGRRVGGGDGWRARGGGKGGEGETQNRAGDGELASVLYGAG